MSGLYCKSPNKKPSKPWKKIFLKFISELLTLIFSQYETGNHRYFFRPWINLARPCDELM
jgi:hypothetical protein